jgi:hypothetical protein
MIAQLLSILSILFCPSVLPAYFDLLHRHIENLEVHERDHAGTADVLALVGTSAT